MAGGNAFDDARQTFHDLRGRLSVIVSCADGLAEGAPPLTDEQREYVERILTTTTDLLAALDAAADQTLSALTLAPTSGIIWTAAALAGPAVQADALDALLQAIGRAVPGLATPGSVVVVAPSALLGAVRGAFTRRGWRARGATAPTDIPPLLARQPADLLVLAPPPADATAWWRMARVALRDLDPRPTLAHLVPEEAG